MRIARTLHQATFSLTTGSTPESRPLSQVLMALDGVILSDKVDEGEYEDDGNAYAVGYKDWGNEYRNTEVVGICSVAFSEFNFTPGDSAALSYEFEFTDYFSGWINFK